MDKKPLFTNMPTRKEMNIEKFSELVTELSKHRGDESENVVMGGLFYLIFSDLSATKQEAYNRLLAGEIKKYKENGEGE